MAEIDLHLRNQVQQLKNMVVQLDQNVGQVSGQVAGVGAMQQDTRNALEQLRSDFQKFVLHSQLTANMQRAETRIGAIQDEMEHEYGHHKVVRRTTVGLLQAFDVGLVTEQTVQTVTEQLMIQTPRYWLAPALVALAAWSADDRTLCDRAVEEAFRRSPGRTSLLFALVLRRQGRQASSVRWLRHYLAAQDPSALGREFAVILEAAAQGGFGPAGREMVQGTLDTWRETMSADQQANAAQVARWRAECDEHRAPSAATDFPWLAQVSPQWPALDSALSSAEAHKALLAKYQALMAAPLPPVTGIEDAIDDILDRLVSEYDNEELPLRKELEFHKAVVAHQGDADAARQAVDADARSFDETLDYLTVQSSAALNPSAIGVSPATQRLAVAGCQPWFRQAHEQFSTAYRGALPQTVEAAFESNHNFGAKAFGLPRWVGSFMTPVDQLELQLRAHWDGHVKPFIDQMAYNLQREAIGPGVVVLLVLVVGMAINPIFGLLVALVVGGSWWLVLRRRHTAALEAQKYARGILEAAREESVRQLRAAGAELRDFETRFQQADQQAGQMTQFIESLRTATHAASPFEQRTVRPDAVTG